MLTFNQKEDYTEEVIKTLQIEMKKKVSGLKNIFNEWPAGNRTLKYPSVSIITAGDAGFFPTMNKSVVLKGPIKTVGTTKTIEVVRETGYFDLRLQIDLWCEHKNQRTEFMHKLQEFFDPEMIPSGLRLNMPDYFNQLVNFTYIGYRYEDGGAAAQRREWRSILRVLANGRALRKKKEFVMATIELDLETIGTSEANLQP